ncbi:beta-ketoacyl-[acyl-carrier-protein] synthase family protein [Flexivirga meconopsidis]|uniref:beta-ketoacyl-[acyl-carrier-protein] synthase family protein n=1 Tax=Flexivirga meconopsidis TaxID=2977121 RepID=UPI00223F1EFF|nr:beta-ketoacyl-[acyl-carrier-protein] synthase family protein [Flexivirga meconopsidis]
MTRVVVTGLGLICDVGNTVQECWDSLVSGRPGIRENTLFDTSGMPTALVGEAAFEGEDGVDRCVGLGSVAIGEALQDAGIDPGQLGERLGFIVGSSLGPMPSLQEFHRDYLVNGADSSAPGLAARSVLHSAADALAAGFGVTGPRAVTSNACAASAVAIGYAAELLWSGEVDAVLTGGVDPLASLSAYGFSSLGALAEGPCSPLAASDGLTLGEGAGFLVLETLESAQERGATVYAEVTGYGLTCDGYHQTAPDPSGDGPLRSMSEALRSSGLTATDVDYINMHGTGTPTNDAVEPKSVRLLLGGQSAPAVSSTKSMTGHTLGAAGAVEAICSVLAIHHGMLPPTVNTGDAADRSGLDIVPEAGRKQDTSVALSNSFAFGGNNASVVLTAPGRVERLPQAKAKKVVISGVSGLTAEAVTSDELRTALRDGSSTFGAPRDIAGLGSIAFGAIDTRPLARKINPAKARRMDPMSILAAAAVTDLYAQIGKPSRAVAADTGVVFGTGFGPLSAVGDFHTGLVRGGVSGANALAFPNTVVNAAAGHLAMLNRYRGYAATLTCGGTSALDALHLATKVMERGAADRILVVVVDEFPQVALDVQARIHPYAADGVVRVGGGTGSVLADGAVAVLLETEEAAEAAGSAPIGRFLGFGACADNAGGARLADDGAAWGRSFELALKRSGHEAVDLFVSAGNGYALVDDAEQLAMKAAGLESAETIAPKEIVGETYGSAAGFGLIAALDRLQANATGVALLSSFAYGASYHAAVVGSC